MSATDGASVVGSISFFQGDVPLAMVAISCVEGVSISLVPTRQASRKGSAGNVARLFPEEEAINLCMFHNIRCTWRAGPACFSTETADGISKPFKFGFAYGATSFLSVGAYPAGGRVLLQAGALVAGLLPAEQAACPGS